MFQQPQALSRHRRPERRFHMWASCAMMPSWTPKNDQSQKIIARWHSPSGNRIPYWAAGPGRLLEQADELKPKAHPLPLVDPISACFQVSSHFSGRASVPGRQVHVSQAQRSAECLVLVPSAGPTPTCSCVTHRKRRWRRRTSCILGSKQYNNLKHAETSSGLL